MDAKETIINFGVSGFYAWFVYVLLVMATSGCGVLSGEIYGGIRRIDEVRQEQVMKDKPLKCLFVDCDNVRGS